MIGCQDQLSNQIHRHRLTYRLSSSREFLGKIQEFVSLYPVHAQYNGECRSMYHQPENKNKNGIICSRFFQHPNFFVYILSWTVITELWEGCENLLLSSDEFEPSWRIFSLTQLGSWPFLFSLNFLFQLENQKICIFCLSDFFFPYFLCIFTLFSVFSVVNNTFISWNDWYWAWKIGKNKKENKFGAKKVTVHAPL